MHHINISDKVLLAANDDAKSSSSSSLSEPLSYQIRHKQPPLYVNLDDTAEANQAVNVLYPQQHRHPLPADPHRDLLTVPQRPQQQRFEVRVSRRHTNCIVIVDPISTGQHLVDLLLRHNYIDVVVIWSDHISNDTKQLVTPGLRNDVACTLLYHGDDYVNTTVGVMLNLGYKNIVGVMAASEPGVECADMIGYTFNRGGRHNHCSHLKTIPNNGIQYSHHRRNKYMMSEAIRKANIRAVHQRQCYSWEECLDFITTNQTWFHTFILKPLDSAGTDDVYKGGLDTIDYLKEKFYHIQGKENKMGSINESVLVQEYLYGTEYVMDVISLHGQHKLAAAWKYIKGSANGSDFVYFGMLLQDGNDPIVKEIFEYTKKCLDALNIANYASHSEIMYHPQHGPCLVETGSRLHGGSGMHIPVCRAVYGFSIIDMLEGAIYGNEEDTFDHKHRQHDCYFSNYPTLCTFKNDKIHGANVDIVAFEEGVIESINQKAKNTIEALPSFHGWSSLSSVGATLHPTVNCFTSPGNIMLVGTHEQIMNDIDTIRAVEHDLFIVKPIEAIERVE